MSILNHSDLTTDITSAISNNGAQEITGDILQQRLLNLADSSVNKLGDTGIAGLLRYSSVFSISNNADLPHKKYVDDAISAAISAIPPVDFSPYPKKDGSDTPITGNWNWGNKKITNIKQIDANDGFQVSNADGFGFYGSNYFNAYDNGTDRTFDWNATSLTVQSDNGVIEMGYGLAIRTSGTSVGDASALLDLISTTKGLGLPSMTSAQLGAISSPRDGLMVYQNDSTKGIYSEINGSWVRMATASDLTGGTVTTVSVVTANGVSGSVANSTTTPAITLTLGAITPSSVNASGTVLGSNLSGTNTGDQTITLTGDVTGSGTGSFATTLATVNSNVGTFNNVTVNSKGLVTAASNVSYLTGNQTITLSGDISGSGSTSINATIGAGKVTNAMLAGSIADSKISSASIWNAKEDGANKVSDYSTIDNTKFATTQASDKRMGTRRFLVPSFTDDFFTSSVPGWATATTGGGGTIGSNGEVGASIYGGIQLNATSTSTAGMQVRRTIASGSISLGNHAYAFVWKIKFPLLSTSTEEFSYWSGLNSGDHSIGTYAVGFQYLRASHGNFWVCITKSGGVETRTVSSVAVLDNTTPTTSEIYLKVEINAAASSVVFSVSSTQNTAPSYTVAATHTTNIPSGSINLSQSAYILKSNGTTTRTVSIDTFHEEYSTFGRGYVI